MKTINTINCLSRDVSTETKLRIANLLFEQPKKYVDEITIRLDGIEKVFNGLFNITAFCAEDESENLITTDFILGLSGLLACEVNIIKILVEGAEAEGDEKMDIVEKSTLEGE